MLSLVPRSCPNPLVRVAKPCSLNAVFLVMMYSKYFFLLLVCVARLPPSWLLDVAVRLPLLSVVFACLSAGFHVTALSNTRRNCSPRWVRGSRCDGAIFGERHSFQS